MTSTISFTENNGVHAGTDSGGRTWKITRGFTGWRLEFSDSGDAGPTYAGMHTSVQAAKDEACR